MIIMMLIITNLTSTKSEPTLKIGMRHLPKKLLYLFHSKPLKVVKTVFLSS